MADDTVVIPFDWPMQPNPPRRPWQTDPDVVLAAATEAIKAVIEQWWPDKEPSDYVEIIDDLNDAFRHGDSDGYAICRRLEQRHSWSPDADLVDILSYPFVHDAHDIAVKRWVQVNGIRPQFEAGTRVKTPHGLGTIKSVREERGEYLVSIDSMDGLGSYIAFENTTAA